MVKKKRMSMVESAIEKNYVPISTEEIKCRLLEIEVEITESCDNFGKERLRRERLKLLKLLKILKEPL